MCLCLMQPSQKLFTQIARLELQSLCLGVVSIYSMQRWSLRNAAGFRAGKGSICRSSFVHSENHRAPSEVHVFRLVELLRRQVTETT